MKRRRLVALAAGSAAVLLVCGVAYADTTATATCTSSPKISTSSTGVRSITVVCSLPPVSQPTVTVTRTVTASPSALSSSSSSPSVSVSPSSSPSVSPTATSTAGSGLNLARVPWEGGPAYYAQFPKAKAAGWADPSFFPIAVWYGSCVADQAKFDQAHGINTYAQCNSATKVSDLNGMDTLFSPADSPTYVGQAGVLLDDEVDGRFSQTDGLAHIKALQASNDPAKTGRFTYANWTSSIVTYDHPLSYEQQYYAVPSVNSLDSYTYSSPQCDFTNGPPRFRTPKVSPASTGQQGTDAALSCRTAATYGKAIDLQLEATTSKPVWAVPEVVATGGDASGFRQPSPAQVKAAVMNSLIHEARGIMWFTQAPDRIGQGNNCASGDVLADVRRGQPACAAVTPNVQALGEVDAQVDALASVLNTQSYVWSFGSGLETMLKVSDGAAYIFAMPRDGGSGSRTFTLPAGVSGGTVEVVGEGRTVPVIGGSFTDGFAAESTYHIYKVSLS